MVESEDDLFTGLGDIVSNLMAIFILLTMIVLIMPIAQVVMETGQSGRGRDDEGDFHPQVIDPLSMPVTYFLVTAKGYAPLHWDRIAPTIAGQTSSADAVLDLFGDGTSAKLSVDPVNAPTMQVGKVRVEITMPQPTGESLVPHGDEVLARLQALKRPGSHFSFIVWPEGLADFVPVYTALREARECFRWEPWESKDPFRRQNYGNLGEARCPAL